MEYLKKNVDITDLSNFKTKAFALYYFEIHSRQDVDKLKDIVNFAGKNNLKILFIGGGTNLFFAFDLFDGIIINNCLQGWSYDKSTKILESYTKEQIWNIAESLEKDYGQDLWHRFIGLPGSIGGAVYGNAGCFGLETENNFSKAEVFDLTSGEFKIFRKKDVLFSYRNSIFKQNDNYFIVKVWFDLSEKVEKYSSSVDNLDFRENKQPKGNSCGSFFKNPSKELSAGFAIEEVGLKGYRYNGAYISEKHANFLMGDGTTCKWQDLIYLINYTVSKVQEKFGITLEPEVRIIKN